MFHAQPRRTARRRSMLFPLAQMATVPPRDSPNQRCSPDVICWLISSIFITCEGSSEIQGGAVQSLLSERAFCNADRLIPNWRATVLGFTPALIASRMALIRVCVSGGGPDFDVWTLAVLRLSGAGRLGSSGACVGRSSWTWPLCRSRSLFRAFANAWSSSSLKRAERRLKIVGQDVASVGRQ